MREGKMTSATSYLTVGLLLLLTCALAQGLHGFRMRKTGRREGRMGARAAGVYQGKVVFGRALDEGTSRESNSSVDDESAYQADSPVLYSPGQSPSDAAWKRMASSLQCGGDQMRFKAVGAGASHFAVDQGKASPPMALSQVPSTCGYTMQRNPFALVMLVPYDGCSVVQEGGSYILPMRWHGIPVSLCCPKPAEPSPRPQLPTNPQEPQKTVTPSLPEQDPMTTIPPKQDPVTTVLPKQEPPNPQMGYWIYPYNLGPPPTAAAPTTAAPTTAAPPTTTRGVQKIEYPFFYPQNAYFPKLVQTPAMPTTKPPQETQAPITVPPQVPHQFPMQFPSQFLYPPQQLPPQQLPPQQHPPQYPQQFQNAYFPKLVQTPAMPTTKPPQETQAPLTFPPQFPLQFPMQFPSQFLYPFQHPQQLPPQQLPPQQLPPQQLPPQQLPPQQLPPQQLPPQQLPPQQLPPQYPQQLPKLPPQYPQQLPQFPPQQLPKLPPNILFPFPHQLFQFPPQFPLKDFIPYTTPVTTTTTTTVTPTTTKSEPSPTPIPHTHPLIPAPFPFYLPYGPYRPVHGSS